MFRVIKGRIERLNRAYRIAVVGYRRVINGFARLSIVFPLPKLNRCLFECRRTGANKPLMI